jgi:hypothetical protein
MKQIHVFFVTALTILSSYAQADIYSQYPTPDTIQCARVSGIANQCLDDTRPQKHVVQYKDQYGQVTTQEEETYERLTCAKSQDKCTDSNGNYRGKTVIGKDFFYIVYKDFYVYPGSDGADWAYKNGTGPLFGGQTAGAAKQKTFQAWCNPEGDTCDVDNISVSREKLPAHIPLSTDISNCNLELCYNSDEDVIGLNPDYYLWKK